MVPEVSVPILPLMCLHDRLHQFNRYKVQACFTRLVGGKGVEA